MLYSWELNKISPRIIPDYSLDVCQFKCDEVLLLSAQERVDRDDILFLRILVKRILAEHILRNVSGVGVDYPMRVRGLEDLGHLRFFSPFLTVDQLPGETNLCRRRHEVGYITAITIISKDDVPQNHMTFYLTVHGLWSSLAWWGGCCHCH